MVPPSVSAVFLFQTIAANFGSLRNPAPAEQWYFFLSGALGHQALKFLQTLIRVTLIYKSEQYPFHTQAECCLKPEVGAKWVSDILSLSSLICSLNSHILSIYNFSCSKAYLTLIIFSQHLNTFSFRLPILYPSYVIPGGSLDTNKEPSEAVPPAFVTIKEFRQRFWSQGLPGLHVI